MLQLNPNKALAELCKRDFYFFVQEFWSEIIPDDPVYNWHIEYLCNELQIIVERVGKRESKLHDLIINIPPGTSKSTIVTVMLPVWSWIIDATLRTLTASYSASLSMDHAVKSRDIIRSDKFRAYFPELEIKKDQDNKTHYKNDFGGERYATSVTGTVTGFHAHLIIVDDPLNPKEASSEVERKNANNFMDMTLSTRKVSKSVTPTILVMQRLHQKDCTGNWLDKKDKRIKHICLPGEVSPDVKPIELKERYIDGLLDPIRLSANDLRDLKIDLGSYGYAGQIMQTPSPLDGGIWQKWLIPINKKDIPKDLQQYGTDWDLAYTEKETNSASAFVTAGKHLNKMYITDIGFEWLEFPKLMGYMQNRVQPHYIEGKACFDAETKVNTEQGLISIKDIKKGDFVMSINEKTKNIEYKKVLNTFVFNPLQYSSNLCIFTLSNGIIIKCTDNHEFYFKGNWVSAKELGKRAMDVDCKHRKKIRYIKYGSIADNKIQVSIRNGSNINNETSIRCEWLSKDNDKYKWDIENTETPSISGGYLDSKPIQQNGSQPYKCESLRQSSNKSGMGNEIRESKALSKIRVKCGFQKRMHTKESDKGVKCSQRDIERGYGSRYTSEIQTEIIHKENVSRRVQHKHTHNNRLHSQRLEAREINIEEILSFEFIDKTDVYDIEVENNHNFCITSEKIIVHNSGKSAKQVLTNNGIPAIEVQVTGGDKIARATMATPYAESGMIYIDEELLNKLYFDVKQGILIFPNGENDDLQDALVQSINRLLAVKSFFVV